MKGKLYKLLRVVSNFILAIGNPRAFTACLIMAPLFLLHFPICILALPLRRVRIGILWSERIGHLALNTELFVRRGSLNRGENSGNRDFTVLIAGNPANEQLLKMWQRELFVLRLPFLHAVLRASGALWCKSYFYEPLNMHSNEYDEFNRAPPSLRFTHEEEVEGRRKLAEWGIDLDRDWFACVFARDDRYVPTLYPNRDCSDQDYRNADIDSFNLAMEEIVARGGFVLRLGFHVKKPLSVKSDRVIDYALSFRSDFMDIFLSAKCRFFLGTTSGIADIATIFDRPRVGVNFVPFGMAPIGKQSLFIPKRIVNTITGQEIPFGRLIRVFDQKPDRILFNGNWALQQGYRHIDNTPEEILAVTREMLDRLDNKHNVSDDDVELQRRYFGLFPKGHRFAKIKTPIGAEFLKSQRELLTF